MIKKAISYRQLEKKIDIKYMASVIRKLIEYGFNGVKISDSFNIGYHTTKLICKKHNMRLRKTRVCDNDYPYTKDNAKKLNKLLDKYSLNEIVRMSKFKYTRGQLKHLIDKFNIKRDYMNIMLRRKEKIEKDIKKLVVKKYTHKEMAFMLTKRYRRRISPNTIKYHLSCLGIGARSNKIGVCFLWNKNEVESLKSMYIAGLPLTYISNKLGRTRAATYMKIVSLIREKELKKNVKTIRDEI